MAQSKAIKEILAYASDSKAPPLDQLGIAKDCCETWNIPFVE
jgi:DNA-directed RNA polymerase subunit N (RpoN/RPB10)